MKKKLLSLALTLSLCLSLTVPVFAKDWQEATPDDVLGTFTIMRNGTVDEKSGTYLSEEKAHIQSWRGETEINYAVVAPTDTWDIGNTGSKTLTASGNAAYHINIWLESYWPDDEIEKSDREAFCEGDFYGWWGNRGHFVEGALESDEHGCDSVLVKPGETTTIPFSAFAQMTGGNTDCIYGLAIRALYPGTSEDDGGMVEQCFYFKLDSDAKSAIDKNAEKDTAITTDKFTDVKSGDYFADAVQWAVEKDITSGTSKTTFSPNATCSKAQILAFLWRANGSPEPTAANPFTDIKTTDYFYKAALWAAQKGLVSGSTFGANTDCTRAMTMEYMWKAAGSPTPAGKADFTDVPASADYAQAVAWAVENEITSGTGGNNFSPAATCTRGQIVTFLHRAMGK
ncbi:MAG: S-layer homology domain-containing protein [Lawsonibacter sp.]|nr:S-layer homology domain-containing protein [Lawsonibacter sp.]